MPEENQSNLINELSQVIQDLFNTYAINHDKLFDEAFDLFFQFIHQHYDPIKVWRELRRFFVELNSSSDNYCVNISCNDFVIKLTWPGKSIDENIRPTFAETIGTVNSSEQYDSNLKQYAKDNVIPSFQFFYHNQ